MSSSASQSEMTNEGVGEGSLDNDRWSDGDRREFLSIMAFAGDSGGFLALFFCLTSKIRSSKVSFVEDVDWWMALSSRGDEDMDHEIRTEMLSMTGGR
jgi:hypothetical protein